MRTELNVRSFSCTFLTLHVAFRYLEVNFIRQHFVIEHIVLSASEPKWH